MHAIQYPITLPADYDMGIIRKRVADFGHLLDDREGLKIKAWLIREKGVGGSPVHQYAPFYLWNDTDAMAHFLVGGGGFQGVIRDFGRPVVEAYVVVAHHIGRGTPQAASRHVTVLEPDADPTGLGLAARIDREIAELDTVASREDVHSAALALDPLNWRLLRFVLWHDAVPDGFEATERYEVLRLSVPASTSQ